MRVIIVISMLVFFQGAQAFRIERLVMPGDLIQGHSKIENDCEKCHQPFNKVSQTQLCKDCHEEIEWDITRKEGYHGARLVPNRECAECHTDHEGRDAKIVLFEVEAFNHKQTDFDLTGKHKELLCNSCHEQGNKYREAQHQCFDCHQGDDPHKEELGKDCSNCHSEARWGETNFNHDKTDYPLRGKHREVACESCHPVDVSKKISNKCVSCHRINDVHGGLYGQECDQCHAVKGWKKNIFDHDKETDFPLRDAHKLIACGGCHERGNLFKEELKKECYSCHKNDDAHRGRNGTECGECHDTVTWDKFRFDHDKETDFLLSGKHKDLSCTDCHRGNLYENELETECVACHVDDDVHQGTEGKLCKICHNETGWNEQIIFEHDMTSFPLLGLHAVIPCEECHLTQVFNEAELACGSCHKEDDIHAGKLGNECKDCHNPNGWSIWQFDHNQQTEYVLNGKHEGLSCQACHTHPTDEKELSTACVDCHKKDDVHDGKLTLFCERCHVTRSFKVITIIR